MRKRKKTIKLKVIKDLTTIHKYIDAKGELKYDKEYHYKCEICGNIYEETYLKRRKAGKIEDVITPCNRCSVSNVYNKKATKFLNNVIYNKDLYINNRLPSHIRKQKTRITFLNKLLYRCDNIRDLDENESLTIGLKNPFKRGRLILEDFIIKTIEQDNLDRERYLYDISKYENTPISRNLFEKECKKQRLNIDDFSEIKSDIIKSGSDLYYYAAKHNNIYKY